MQGRLLQQWQSKGKLYYEFFAATIKLLLKRDKILQAVDPQHYSNSH